MNKRPNRTKPRYFSSCDAARIAREVVRDRDETPEEVLACIAKGFGFTHISMSRVKSVQANVAGLGVALLSLKGLLVVLRRALGVLATRDGIERIIRAIDDAERMIDRTLVAPEQRRVEDVVKCRCKV